MTDLALTEERTIELLAAVVAADGSVRIARRRLKDRGTEVAEKELRQLVEANRGAYQALSVEVAGAREEAITQEYRNIARLSQQVTMGMLEDLAAAIDEGGIEAIPYELRRQLPQTLGSLSKVMQVSTDKLLALQGRPIDGGDGDPRAAIKELVDMGLLIPRPKAVESDAEADD